MVSPSMSSYERPDNRKSDLVLFPIRLREEWKSTINQNHQNAHVELPLALNCIGGYASKNAREQNVPQIVRIQGDYCQVASV